MKGSVLCGFFLKLRIGRTPIRLGVTRCYLELPLPDPMKFSQRGKSRKKRGKSRASGPPGMVLVAVGGKQILFVQSRWNPVEFLGSLPIWGEPLSLSEIHRFLFPGEPWLMKRPTTTTSTPTLYAAPVDDLKPDLALVADYLALTAFEGEPVGSRQTGSLLIFPDGGVWKAMLKDKNTGKCLWIAFESLLDVFSVLEESLSSPSAIWRDDRHAGHEQAKRNKPGRTA